MTAHSTFSDAVVPARKTTQGVRHGSPCRHRRCTGSAWTARCAATLCVVVAALAASAAERPPAAAVENGRLLLRQFGCSTCHRIPGVPTARGNVGPPLEKMGERAYIAGILPNTTENLVLWIQRPKAINPKTAMPDLGVSEAHARDMAAYLATLR